MIAIERPIFLLCSERSGSNLIRALFGAHGQVWAPYPLHLALTVGNEAWRYGADEAGRERLLRHVLRRVSLLEADPGFALDEAELRAALASGGFPALYRALYRRGLAAHGKARLFMKENHLHRALPWLLPAFPDALFVAQVRDPRDFLASCRRLRTPSPKYRSVDRALRVWTEDQQALLALKQNLGPSRVHLLRYEDLVADPEPHLRDACAFAGLPWDPAMLRFHEDPGLRDAARRVPAWSQLGQPLSDRSGAGRQLPRAARRLTELRCGPLMRALGYELREPPPGLVGRFALRTWGAATAAVDETRAGAREALAPLDPYAELSRDRDAHLPAGPPGGGRP